MKTILVTLCFIAAAFFLSGCPATEKVRKEAPSPPPSANKPAEPGIVIRFASLNLAKYTKRIEKTDLHQFSDVLKKEKIDVLAVQGISRYPGVTSRIDLVDELSFDAEMRNVFGETIDLSGRQNGNAIFSAYPIRSSENSHYDGIRSSNFESALQAVIDCGARDVVFVSTLLPEKASTEDVATCVNRLSEFPVYYINNPVIIGGNLPQSDVLRTIARFDATRPVKEDDGPRVWFANDGSLKLLGQSVAHTQFGPLMIAEFGVFKKTQP